VATKKSSLQGSHPPIIASEQPFFNTYACFRQPGRGRSADTVPEPKAVALLVTRLAANRFAPQDVEEPVETLSVFLE